MLVIDAAAPEWAQEMARRVDQLVDTARLGPFVSFKQYDAGGTLPDPAKYPNKVIFLTNGTFWLAKSDGSAWNYPDNTAV